MSRETEAIFLYGLADELGVPANFLRRALVREAGKQFKAPTTDQDADFVLKSDGTTASDFFTLAVAGDAGGGDEVEVTTVSTQFGMSLMSNLALGCSGLDVSINGVGDDDDVHCKLLIYGILPDNQPLTLLLASGLTTIPLPMRTMESDVYFKFINPNATTTINVALAATAKRVDSEVALAGQRDMRGRGIQVGKAKSALFGGMSKIAEGQTDSILSGLGSVISASKSRDSGGVMRALDSIKRNGRRLSARKLRSGVLSLANDGAEATGETDENDESVSYSGKTSTTSIKSYLAGRGRSKGVSFNR